MAELTARTAVEKEVTLINDVKQLRKELDELNKKTLEGILEIDNMRISEDNRLGGYIDRRFDDLISELQATFATHEAWIDELELEDDTIYQSIDNLDKKLSDRIKDN